MTQQFLDALVLMAVLFNPFLMSAYLHDVMSELSLRQFSGVLLRAFVISGLVFWFFAAAGDHFFESFLQVRFAAFLVFGGVLFAIIALRYMVSGAKMVEVLRGSPEHIAGTLAMPFMIGPGTVSASVVIGNRLPLLLAFLAIAVAMTLSCAFLLLSKILFDGVRHRSEALVERYLEIAGRVAAIVMGTIAVDMIMRGVDMWLHEAV